ncbi:MAG: ribonuclease Z [Bacteroidota bacterium]
MMDFALTILGVNGAKPAFGRFPTSQFLQIQNHFFLIDCGEGAQMRLSDFGMPASKVDHIFISHLHGDHIFGLPGLLFSFALNDRSKPLHVYSPPGLEQMIMAQLTPGGQLPFAVHFHVIPTDKSVLIFENDALTVSTVPLIHRIPASGFLFREKQFQKNIIGEKISEHQLSIAQIKAVKQGEDILLDNGKTLKNEELTHPDYIPRSYAFASDTMYNEAMIPIINHVDLLYHETTFCEDRKENAVITQHSTAQEAATIARKASVGKLITGHYSSRYKELDIFQDEAASIFGNTVLGLEGKTYKVGRLRKQ